MRRGTGTVVAPLKRGIASARRNSRSRSTPTPRQGLDGPGAALDPAARCWKSSAEVNKKAKAKDWDSAIIKEIVSLEVGNQVSQDQRSLAKGDQLTEAADVLSPAQKAAADAAVLPERGRARAAEAA